MNGTPQCHGIPYPISNNVSSNNKGDGIALSQVTAESVTNKYL